MLLRQSGWVWYFGVVKCIRKGCDEGWYGWIFNWGMVRVE